MIILLAIIAVVLSAMCVILAIRLSKAVTQKALLDQELRLVRNHDESQQRLSDLAADMIDNSEKRFNALADKLIADSEQRMTNAAYGMLDTTSRKLKEQNEERLGEILAPLREDITQFKKTVAESYQTEARERFSLSERIRELISLNQSISQQAKELSEALRGNSKVQGDWGEMVLETLLEKSGLRRNVHYVIQPTRDDDGKVLRNEQGVLLRPDVVINYPDRRCIVVDSKVSLTAYVNLVNAEDAESVARYGEQHVASVKAHIKELAGKKYQDYVGNRRTDFVMMFIPNEGAYMTAMNLEPTLWQQAYDARVIIISPTHLLSAVRLVQQLWQQDDIKRNAIEIADEAGKMYDKFVGFVDDMEKIGKAIDSVRVTHEEAVKKLSTGKGNLIRRATEMKRLGAKAQKIMPQSLVDSSEDDDEPKIIKSKN